MVLEHRVLPAPTSPQPDPALNLGGGIVQPPKDTGDGRERWSDEHDTAPEDGGYRPLEAKTIVAPGIVSVEPDSVAEQSWVPPFYGAADFAKHDTQHVRGYQLPPSAYRLSPLTGSLIAFPPRWSNESYYPTSSLYLSPDEVARIESTNVHRFSNAQTNVQTIVQAGPATEITDPALLKSGVFAKKLVFGNPEPGEEPLFPGYKRQPKRFFCVGRVFMVLWAEPAGANSVITNPQITQGIHGELVYQQTRRFVVVRESDKYCTALPITTYGGRGVAKPGVKKSEHAIVYSGKSAPAPDVSELPVRGESGLRRETIRVVVDAPTEALDPMSRLDFGRAHTIQHNVKAKAFGMVHTRAREAFAGLFFSVMLKNDALNANKGGQYSVSGRGVGSACRTAVLRDWAALGRVARAEGQVLE